VIKTDYWLRLCDEDVKTVKINLKGKRYLVVAFFCLLIAEKSLKAVISELTNAVPPYTHNLKRLAEIGGIYNDLSDDERNLLQRLTPLNIEGRYAEYKDTIRKSLTPKMCKTIFTETEAFLCMIKKKLGR